jgi:hypothetical protein
VKKLVFLAFAVVLMIGCATTKPNETIRTESQYYIIPDIGIETTVYIGESLIKEGRTSARDAVYLNEDHGKVGWTAFHPAGIYILIGKTDGASIYQHKTIMPGVIGTVYPQIIEDPDGKVYLKTLTSRDLLNSTEYSKRKFVEETGDDFEQTLIYTGAERTILKFTYREFSNNIARPAFTVDATYDMSIDNIIRFRGALLEIIETDNQSITYKVLSGFRSDR